MDPFCVLINNSKHFYHLVKILFLYQIASLPFIKNWTQIFCRLQLYFSSEIKKIYIYFSAYSVTCLLTDDINQNENNTLINYKPLFEAWNITGKVRGRHSLVKPKNRAFIWKTLVSRKHWELFSLFPPGLFICCEQNCCN